MVSPVDRQALLELSFDRRSQAWSSWGRLEGDVLSHLINPTFMGGPRWPGMRQAFRVVRQDHAVLVASDGLSDPYDEGEGPADVNGLGLECFVVSSEPIQTLPGTWIFDLVWSASQQAAQHGDLAALLDEYGVLSMELYDIGIPAEHSSRFVNAEGGVGVLLGTREPRVPREIAGPLSPIRLVGATLLTLDELRYIVEGGPGARRDIAERLGSVASSLSRPSLGPDQWPPR